jgi:hypothetical protein
MAKSVLKPSLGDAFDVGKKEGMKEAFNEMLEIIKVGDLKHLEIYVKARLKSVVQSGIKNPFKGDK